MIVVPDLGKLETKIILSDIGMINETDVSLAKAANALLIGFNVKPNREAKKLAEEAAAKAKQLAEQAAAKAKQIAAAREASGQVCTRCAVIVAIIGARDTLIDVDTGTPRKISVRKAHVRARGHVTERAS